MSKPRCTNCESRIPPTEAFCSERCKEALWVEITLRRIGFAAIAKDRAYGGLRALLREWQLLHKPTAAIALSGFFDRELRVNQRERIPLDEVLDYLGYTREELEALPDDEPVEKAQR